MKTKEQHQVTFLSPGTFFSEPTTKIIESWDAAVAVEMSQSVTERYGARPYAFRLETVRVADEETELATVAKTLRKSGLHYINATIRPAAEVLAGTDPSESILRSNVECNEWNALAVTTNSFKHVGVFEPDDVAVNLRGEIVARGSDYVADAWRTR